MASNARFHNKYHRRNHHSIPSEGFPDSGADPIASPQEPFRGDFHAIGALSATGNLTIGGNTLIYGNLSALGDFSVVDTIVTVTSALSVINESTGPALTVQQKGNQPIAIFFDDNSPILQLKDGLRAEFFNSQATNTYALAEGQATLAQGNASHSEGQQTTASGNYSHAEGTITTASGTASHAEGDSTYAQGQGSHAEGSSTAAEGLATHAEGVNTLASGAASHAEGTATFASNNSTHAEGYSTSATGLYSHSEGSDTNASGNISHAEGLTTRASGPYSHAEGESTIASGDTSHAEGFGTVASGDFSHAQGDTTSAEGVASHAEGALTRAAKDYSHAAGYGAVAAHDRSWIWKGDTVADPISTTRTDQFMVSAAGGVYVPGNVGIGTDSIANALTVVGNVSASRSVIGTSLSGRFVDISHTPANDGSNPYLRIGEATSDAVNFSGFKIEYNETTNDLNLSAIGFNTSKEALKITSAGNTRINLLSAISPNYDNLTAVTRGISGAGFDNLSHLINGRIGVNNQAPVSSYALHVKGGNIRVDGADFSAIPGFDGTIYDSDGQSLFDLRSATPNANYSLSIASSGLNNFMKFFGGRSLDQNPFVAVRKGQPIRFAQMNNFYGQGFSEVARIGGNGNVSIGLSADGAERLTVLGNISASGALLTTSITSRGVDLIHTPFNDGTNPVLRFGESDYGTGSNGFSGAIMSYNENTNVFGISSQFAPGAGLPAVAINRFSNVGIGTDSPAERLTVNGNISSNGSLFVRDLSANNLTVSGNISASGSLTINGNTTLGDNNLDTLILNGSSVSIPNNLNFNANTLFIDAANNRVGIGTAVPAAELTVSGNISASGSVNALSSNVGIVVNDKTTSYTFNNEDNCKIVHFDTTTQSLCAIFPSSLRTDFNCAVMNTGTNVLTLSTYTTLRAIAPNISTRYGAAFVYKDSSNNIYAVGRL